MRLALVVMSLWVGASASDLPVPRSVTSQPAESVRTTSSGLGVALRLRHCTPRRGERGARACPRAGLFGDGRKRELGRQGRSPGRRAAGP